MQLQLGNRQSRIISTLCVKSRKSNNFCALVSGYLGMKDRF